MPKAILEFNLDEPYEENAFKRAFNSTNAYICIHSFEEYLRSLEKYDHYKRYFTSDMSARDHEVAQIIVSEIRAMFFNIQEEYDINIGHLE